MPRLLGWQELQGGSRKRAKSGVAQVRWRKKGTEITAAEGKVGWHCAVEGVYSISYKQCRNPQGCLKGTYHIVLGHLLRRLIQPRDKTVPFVHDI